MERLTLIQAMPKILSEVFRIQTLIPFCEEDTTWITLWKIITYPFWIPNAIAITIYEWWGAAFCFDGDAPAYIYWEDMRHALQMVCIWLAAPFILRMYEGIGRFMKFCCTGDWQ
jgi:hypothetical protein